MKSIVNAFALAAVVLLALVGCAGESVRREALALVDDGRYEEALAKLERAVRDKPENAEARSELLRRREQVVDRLLQGAQREHAAGAAAEAAAAYERVLALQPGNARAKSGLAELDAERRQRDLVSRARDTLANGDAEAAQALLRVVLRENPSQREGRALQRQIDEQKVRDGLAAPTLKIKGGKPINLEFRDANLRLVLAALSRSTGVNFVFDKDVNPDTKTTLLAQKISFEAAIELLLITNQLEKKIIGENTILIYPNTQQKVRDYQDLLIRSFYLENADAKTTLNLIKTMLKTRDAFVDEKLNLLVMRDTPDAIRLAEKLIAAHDLAEPEVLLEIEVIEITRSKLAELGVKWTDQFTFGILDFTPGSFVLRELRNITPGRITLNPPTATLNLKATDGASNVLATPRVRVKNRDKARIMIGDRVPVISSQITPSSTNPVVTENVSYLDVGLKLEVEPNVHLDDEVDIKVSLEVSNLGERTATQNGTIAYRVGTRNATTTLRLRDGETQVLMGLIRDDDRRSANGVPGISEFPVLSHLFATNGTETTKTEIVLSVTPRVVRNVRRVEARLAEFWSGTEASLRAEPFSTRQLPSAGGGEARAGEPALARASDEPAPAVAPAEAAAPVPLGAVQLLWQGPGEAKVGDEVTLELRARTAERVNSAAVQIGFDAATLEFVRIVQGDFMKQGGAASAMNHRADPAAGTVTVRFARAGPGATGEGSLAAVTFRVREGAQTARVRTLAVSPVGPGNQPLSPAQPPPHQVVVGR